MDVSKMDLFPQTIICFVNISPGALRQDQGRIGTALAISRSFAGI